MAPHIEPARRVLELNFAPRGRGPEGERLSHPVAPFAHTIGLVGAERDAVILNDYEALTSVFPLKYRSSAGRPAGEHDCTIPPTSAWTTSSSSNARTCRPIDYIVVWQADPRGRAHAGAAAESTRPLRADLRVAAWRACAGASAAGRRSVRRDGILKRRSRAGVAKLADARDSKSRAGHPACGFDSLLRHHLAPRVRYRRRSSGTRPSPLRRPQTIPPAQLRSTV